MYEVLLLLQVFDLWVPICFHNSGHQAENLLCGKLEKIDIKMKIFSILNKVIERRVLLNEQINRASDFVKLLQKIPLNQGYFCRKTFK